MIPQQKPLARNLFRIGAIKFGAFRLTLHEKQPDAPLSPIYADLRLLRSYPRVMSQAVNEYSRLIEPLQFDLVADVPTAATPFVGILAHELVIPMITPREPKTHGTGARIDGSYREKEVVLLIDDLITRANSKMRAIKILETEGLVVQDIAVLVDRQQGGAEVLRQAGYALHSVFTISELLELYLEDGSITQEQYAETMTYLGL